MQTRYLAWGGGLLKSALVSSMHGGAPERAEGLRCHYVTTVHANSLMLLLTLKELATTEQGELVVVVQGDLMAMH